MTTDTVPLTLPADPEDMNDARADWAQGALTAFIGRQAMDESEAAPDLICDLMHWYDRHPEAGTFARALEQAQSHYEAETEAQPTSPGDCGQCEG
jgi:hypothetical protein